MGPALDQVLTNTSAAGPAFSSGAPDRGATGTIHYLWSTPTGFSFTPVGNAVPGTDYVSNSITVSNTNAPSPIAIGGGKYSIDGGAFVSTSGTVQPGDSVRLQVLAASNYAQERHATVNIGGVSGTFSVTTENAPSGSSSGGSGSSSSSGSGSGGSSGSSGSSGGGSGGGGAADPVLLLVFSLAVLTAGRSRTRIAGRRP